MKHLPTAGVRPPAVWLAFFSFPLLGGLDWWFNYNSQGCKFTSKPPQTTKSKPPHPNHQIQTTKSKPNKGCLTYGPTQTTAIKNSHKQKKRPARPARQPAHCIGESLVPTGARVVIAVGPGKKHMLCIVYLYIYIWYMYTHMCVNLQDNVLPLRKSQLAVLAK